MKKTIIDGVAVFKLVGYCKDAKSADELINKKFKQAIKQKDKFLIFRKERMKLWGAEYDK